MFHHLFGSSFVFALPRYCLELVEVAFNYWLDIGFDQSSVDTWVAGENAVVWSAYVCCEHVGVDWPLTIRGDVKIRRSLPLLAASGCCGVATFCRQLK